MVRQRNDSLPGCLAAALLLIAAAAPAGAWGASLPRCQVRTGLDGGPAILINGKPFAPLLFAANNQFDRDDVLLRELRQAADAGIRLFSFQVYLDWQWPPEKAAEVVDQFCKANPEGYFYVRVWLGANRSWMDEHPDECIAKADGTRTPWVSPSSEAWREITSDLLRQRIRQIAEGPHGDRFIGVCLTALQTGEWFYPDTNEFMDYSPANLRAFRAWLKKKHRNNGGLRSAWGDPEIGLDTAAFPTPEARDEAAWGPFRDPVRHRAAMDMQEFQADLVAETVAYFAKAAKEATQGWSLVGAFYGYTMELNDNGPRALAQSGHLAFAKVLECKDLDLIHAPFSYFERGVGQPGHLHLPADSIALHRKLGILEEDAYTHLAQEPDAGLIAPGWPDRTKTIEETQAVARRDFAIAFTHGCGMWFFDLLSDGRWSDPRFWNSAPLFRRMAAEARGKDEGFRPEVAVLVDEDSANAMRAATYPYLLHALSYWRSELDRIGAPVGYYLQSDLPRLPDSIKVLILANALQVTKAESAALDRHFKRAHTVVWTYAPGIWTPEGIDASAIGARVGMTVEAKFDQVPMTLKSELTDETVALDEASWQPRFVVAPSDPQTNMEVLARYKQTNEISAAAAPMGAGVSVYTATPRLPVGLLRVICARSGVHLYCDRPGMTGLVGPYLVVHTETAGPHTFSWPAPCKTITRVAPPLPGPLGENVPSWSDTLPAHTTAIYECR